MKCDWRLGTTGVAGAGSTSARRSVDRRLAERGQVWRLAPAHGGSYLVPPCSYRTHSRARGCCIAVATLLRDRWSLSVVVIVHGGVLKFRCQWLLPA